MKRYLLILASLVFSGSAAAQTAPVEDVELCSLVANTKTYDGKMIRVRAPISLAFEDFTLDIRSCRYGDNPYMIWLEYGSGIKGQPEIWCCGDLTSHDRLQLLQDDNFQRFHKRLTERSGNKDCSDIHCYKNRVTATITGRVDVAHNFIRVANSDSMIPWPGFGHMSRSPARLLIHSVADISVEVKPLVLIDVVKAHYVVRSMKGTLLDAHSSQPVQIGWGSWVDVSIGKDKDHPLMGHLVTNGNKFEFEDVPDGRYRVRVTAREGYHSLVATVVVSSRANPDSTLEFRLRPNR